MVVEIMMLVMLVVMRKRVKKVMPVVMVNGASVVV